MPVSPDLPQLPPDLRDQRILFVEDSQINREIAVESLTDAGLRGDRAESGLIACQMVERHGTHCAAVLMDVQMPAIDGLTATRRMRPVIRPAAMRVPGTGPLCPTACRPVTSPPPVPGSTASGPCCAA